MQNALNKSGERSVGTHNYALQWTQGRAAPSPISTSHSVADLRSFKVSARRSHRPRGLWRFGLAASVFTTDAGTRQVRSRCRVTASASRSIVPKSPCGGAKSVRQRSCIFVQRWHRPPRARLAMAKLRGPHGWNRPYLTIHSSPGNHIAPKSPAKCRGHCPAGSERRSAACTSSDVCRSILSVAFAAASSC